MKRNIQIEVMWRNHVRGNEDNAKCKYLWHERNDHVHYNCARSIFNASFSTFNVKFFHEIYLFSFRLFFSLSVMFFFLLHQKWKLVHICKLTGFYFKFFLSQARFFHHFSLNSFFQLLTFFSYSVVRYFVYYAYIFIYSLLLFFDIVRNNDHHRHHTSIAQLIMMIFVLSK